MAVDTEEGFLETNFKVCLIHVKVVIKSFSMFADVANNPAATNNSQCLVVSMLKARILPGVFNVMSTWLSNTTRNPKCGSAELC